MAFRDGSLELIGVRQYYKTATRPKVVGHSDVLAEPFLFEHVNFGDITCIDGY